MLALASGGQGRVPLHTAEQRVNEEEVVEKTTTQMYRAPEMVDLYMERELTEKVDVWVRFVVKPVAGHLFAGFYSSRGIRVLSMAFLVSQLGWTEIASRPCRPFQAGHGDYGVGVHRLSRSHLAPVA